MGTRVHPFAKVGDRFGDRTVTSLLPVPHRGRSDERVAWKCRCGVVGTSLVFNLRGRPLPCRHGAKPRRAPSAARVCACDHSVDDHRPKGGVCLEDDCDCFGFEAKVA